MIKLLIFKILYFRQIPLMNMPKYHKMIYIMRNQMRHVKKIICGTQAFYELAYLAGMFKNLFSSLSMLQRVEFQHTEPMMIRDFCLAQVHHSAMRMLWLVSCEVDGHLIFIRQLLPTLRTLVLVNSWLSIPTFVDHGPYVNEASLCLEEIEFQGCLRCDTLASTNAAICIPRYPEWFPRLRLLSLYGIRFNTFSWITENMFPLVTSIAFEALPADKHTDIPVKMRNLTNLTVIRTFHFFVPHLNIENISDFEIPLQVTTLTEVQLHVDEFFFPLVYNIVRDLPLLRKLKLFLNGRLQGATNTNVSSLSEDRNFRRLKAFKMRSKAEKPRSISDGTIFEVNRKVGKQMKFLFTFDHLTYRRISLISDDDSTLSPTGSTYDMVPW